MRAIWTGAIGFGLVSIPVKLYSAVENHTLDFDLLDAKDHARIRFMRVNENTQKEVPYDRIVKGYKIEDDYVIMDEQDFEDAAPEKSHEVTIENFVEMDEIDPMYYETSYYAGPAGKASKAYALLVQALQKSKKAGLARFVLRSSESLCVIHPVKNILVVTRIRFAHQIRSTEDIDAPKAEVTKKELDMGLALIDQYSGKFDISKFKDEYTDELLNIIKLKAKGKRATVKKMKVVKTTNDDLYDQLMASLQKKGA